MRHWVLVEDGRQDGRARAGDAREEMEGFVHCFAIPKDVELPQPTLDQVVNDPTCFGDE